MHEIIASALPNLRRGIAVDESAILPFCSPKKSALRKPAALISHQMKPRHHEMPATNVKECG